MTLCRELAALGPDSLPLAQTLSRGSYVADAPIQVRVIAAREAGTHILVRIGVFFSGIVAGCSCADDPTPVEEQPEYAEFTLRIDRTTGAAQVAPLDG